MDGINTAIMAMDDREPDIQRTPQYVNEKDGLIYCHLCGEPKQSILWFGSLDYKNGEMRKVGHLCKCETLQRDAENHSRRNVIRREYNERLRNKGIPDIDLRKQTFDSDNGLQKHMGLAKEYAVGFKEKFQPYGLGFVFYGDTGTGKSYTASCIANFLIDINIPVLMTSFARIKNESWSVKDKDAYFRSFNQYELLILDDLGVESGSEHSLEQVYTVIDDRVRAKKPMIVTTNLSLEELNNPPTIALKRIYQRILNGSPPVAFDGIDLREVEREKNTNYMRDQFRKK